MWVEVTYVTSKPHPSKSSVHNSLCSFSFHWLMGMCTFPVEGGGTAGKNAVSPGVTPGRIAMILSTWACVHKKYISTTLDPLYIFGFFFLNKACHPNFILTREYSLQETPEKSKNNRSSEQKSWKLPMLDDDVCVGASWISYWWGCIRPHPPPPPTSQGVTDMNVESLRLSIKRIGDTHKVLGSGTVVTQENQLWVRLHGCAPWLCNLLHDFEQVT